MREERETRTILPGLLGAPVCGVAVDEAHIRPEGWRRVDLAALAGGRAGAFLPRTVVVGRSHSACFDRPSLSPPTMALSPADTPAVAPDEASFVGVVAAERRLARLVRVAPALPPGLLIGEKRPGEGFVPAAATPLVRPLAAPRGVVWQPPGHAVLSDKANFKPLIILMIMAWAAIVAFGAYKGMTPPSGLKIIWDDR